MLRNVSFARKKIHMSDKSSKWLPYNEDGRQHDCKKKDSVPNNRNDISVEVLLKKLESVGITIDLQRLRNLINDDQK